MNERFDSDLDYYESIAEESEPLTIYELSELASIVESMPYAEPMSLYDWESKKEAQDHIAEYGDMTAEDYRARMAYEGAMLASIWAGRVAA